MLRGQKNLLMLYTNKLSRIKFSRLHDHIASDGDHVMDVTTIITRKSIFSNTAPINKIAHFDGTTWKEGIIPYGADRAKLNEETTREMSLERF